MIYRISETETFDGRFWIARYNGENFDNCYNFDGYLLNGKFEIIYASIYDFASILPKTRREAISMLTKAIGRKPKSLGHHGRNNYECFK